MITVSYATPGDIPYVDSLQWKNADQVAFFPRQVFEREVCYGRVLLARLNNDPCGYLYHGAVKGRCKIHQACIQYDARGYMYGAALVSWLIDMCQQAGVYSIHLRCGSDIAANGFWQWMGFYCEAVTHGGVSRMRDLNCWRYDVVDDLFPAVVAPSNKQKDYSVWRGSNIRAGSTFLRGRASEEFRKKVLEGSK